VRCRYRDTHGVTRIVQRVGPSDEFDKRGRLAEDALIEALAERRPPSGLDAIGLDTLVMVLIDQHIARLAEDGRSVRTLDTYCYERPSSPSQSPECASVRPRQREIDAALRSMRTARPHDGPAGTHPLTRSPSTRRAK
jgi:hypothetical protein